MKVTLRDLFWLILVAAVGLGWFAHFRSWQREIYKMQSANLTTQAELHRQIGDLWKELALRERARFPEE